MPKEIQDDMILMIILVFAMWGFADIRNFSKVMAWAVLSVMIASLLGGYIQFRFKQGVIKPWWQAIKSEDKSLLEYALNRARINTTVYSYSDIGNIFIFLVLILFCVGLLTTGFAIGEYLLAITNKTPAPIN